LSIGKKETGIMGSIDDATEPAMEGVFHPVDGSRDTRYEVANEFCGYEKARPVLRFAGEFIGSYLTESEAWQAGRTHNRERRAAMLGIPVTGEHGTS
jgi:hypothetical protein